MPVDNADKRRKDETVSTYTFPQPLEELILLFVVGPIRLERGPLYEGGALPAEIISLAGLPQEDC